MCPQIKSMQHQVILARLHASPSAQAPQSMRMQQAPNEAQTHHARQQSIRHLPVSCIPCLNFATATQPHNADANSTSFRQTPALGEPQQHNLAPLLPTPFQSAFLRRPAFRSRASCFCCFATRRTHAPPHMSSVPAETLHATAAGAAISK